MSPPSGNGRWAVTLGTKYANQTSWALESTVMAAACGFSYLQVEPENGFFAIRERGKDANLGWVPS